MNMIKRCSEVLTFSLVLSLAALPQVRPGPAARKSQQPTKQPFVSSNFFWSWYPNGLTTFSFSLKNLTGHDVKNVKYRVLFFDRRGEQIDFAESVAGRIPKGLAQRVSVTLDLDTGMSTRKLSTNQRVEILDFDQEE